jgi:CDGSH-type Zn-finger protein
MIYSKEPGMTEAISTQNCPYKIELDEGKYWWCACGRSKNQPFCDGSHQGTDFTPIKLNIEEKKAVWLCGCRRSGNKPYCDGSHNFE